MKNFVVLRSQDDFFLYQVRFLHSFELRKKNSRPPKLTKYVVWLYCMLVNVKSKDERRTVFVQF